MKKLTVSLLLMTLTYFALSVFQFVESQRKIKEVESSIIQLRDSLRKGLIKNDQSSKINELKSDIWRIEYRIDNLEDFAENVERYLNQLSY